MPGRRGFQGRFVGWSAVAILATYAMFVGGAWAPTYSVFFRVITLVLASAGLTVWVVVAIRDPFWRPRTTLAPAFLAAFAAFVVSALVSRFPRFGFEYLAWSVLLAALYLLLQRLMVSPFFRARLVGFATFAVLAIGTWYLVAVAARWIEWWNLVGRLAAPPLRPGFESLVFGNPSAVLTMSMLLAAPTVAAHWGASGARTGLAAIIVLLTSFVVVASGSRAGWLAIAMAVGIVGMLFAMSPVGRRLLHSVLRSGKAIAAAAAGVAAASLLALAVAPGLLARAGAGGEALRGTFYQASLRMFESSPLVGTGPGTWAPLRVTYTLAGETDYYIPHAHSLYFQTLAEFGLIGVVAGLVVAAYLARLLARAIRGEDPTVRRMGWAALLATVYFAAHQLLDFYENAPAILFAFAIPIAWLDGVATSPPAAPIEQEGRGRRMDRIRRPLLAAGVAVVVAAVGFLGWSETAATNMNDGTIAMNTGDVASAIGPLETAARMDPAMPPYRFTLGLARADNGNPRGAESEFLAAATTDDLPIAWLNLAAVRVELGDRPGAGEALDRALRLGEQQAAIALAGGTIATQLGDRERAVALYARAALLLPSLAGDPWWTADETRAGLWAEALPRAIAEAEPTVRFELAMESGDLTAARQALADVGDATVRETLDLVLAAWTGDDASLVALEQRARERPLDYALVNWSGRLLRREGDAAAAAGYERWADTVAVLSSAGSYEARVVDIAGDERLAGVSSAFYGHYTYRRPTPWNQFVGSLPVIAYR